MLVVATACACCSVKSTTSVSWQLLQKTAGHNWGVRQRNAHSRPLSTAYVPPPPSPAGRFHSPNPRLAVCLMGHAAMTSARRAVCEGWLELGLQQPSSWGCNCPVAALYFCLFLINLCTNAVQHAPQYLSRFTIAVAIQHQFLVSCC